MEACVFSLGSQAVKVVYESDSDTLVWEGGSEPKTCVKIEDIYAVREENSTLTVHYVATKVPGAWAGASVTFSGAEPELCTQWRKHLQDAINRIGQGRPKSVLVFINPNSGSGKAVSTYDSLAKPLLTLAGVSQHVIVTEDKNHAERVINDYDLTTIDSVLVVGGDGSFMLVSTALMKRAMKDAGKDADDRKQSLIHCPIKLGILPGGTGQGLVKMFYGMPPLTVNPDYTTAVLQIILGHTTPGKLMAIHNNDKLVAYAGIQCSYGLLGKGFEKAEERRYLGGLRYLVGAIGQLTAFRQPYDITLRVISDTSDEPATAVRSGAYKMADGFGVHWKSDCLSYDVDTMNIITMDASSSRWGFFRFLFYAALHRLSRATQLPGVEMFYTREYVLELPPLLEGCNEYHSFNMDGDCLRLQPGTVNVKLHMDVFKAYGIGPLKMK